VSSETLNFAQPSYTKQQALDLPLPEQKLYGNWVRHGQVEVAHARLALWLVKGGNIWLSSEEVAGKSHFMHALKSEHPSLVLLEPHVQPCSHIQQLKLWLDRAEHHVFWLVDLPAGLLPQPLALAVFHLIERAKEMHKELLISYRSEMFESLPPELTSRLRMCERVDMTPPRLDKDLQAVLESVLQTMQWDMKETVLPTLLQYLPRDLALLLQAIDALDAYSKVHKVKMNAVLALKVLGLKSL